MDNWTRITDDPDSLPEENTPVLGLFHSMMYRHCIRERDGKWWFVTPCHTEEFGWTWTINHPAVLQPTHWRPLPEPPRE